VLELDPVAAERDDAQLRVRDPAQRGERPFERDEAVLPAPQQQRRAVIFGSSPRRSPGRRLLCALVATTSGSLALRRRCSSSSSVSTDGSWTWSSANSRMSRSLGPSKSHSAIFCRPSGRPPSQPCGAVPAAAISTSLSTRSGWSAASLIAVAPPIELPISE
jgi:hypothetical protein